MCDVLFHSQHHKEKGSSVVRLLCSSYMPVTVQRAMRLIGEKPKCNLCSPGYYALISSHRALLPQDPDRRIEFLFPNCLRRLLSNGALPLSLSPSPSSPFPLSLSVTANALVFIRLEASDCLVCLQHVEYFSPFTYEH